MKYRWTVAPAQPALVEFLARQTGVSALLAQCLLNRGLSEPEPIERFLEPRLRHLADPYLLPNMRAAVERLFQARAQRELVVLFGDYDADGVTATALLTEALGALGWRVDHYLPHRMDEGYGLSQGAVENCLAQKPASLLLAVDCGSTAVDTIEWLHRRGVDVIVLDHHQVSDPPPRPVAMVNPLADRATVGRPRFHELCSAGLAWKLAHAVVKHGRQQGLPEAARFDLKRLLDLVALGTIPDLVPLTGENRILVRAGLEHLNQTRRPGLVCLRQAAGLTGRIEAHEVGYALGPRLNAAGRLETAAEALQLLLAPTMEDAAPLARKLEARNAERKQIERDMAAQVIGAVKARFQPDRDFVIVEGHLLWHLGVVGIVASRVLSEFHRPTIILGGDGDVWRGSGRSIEGFDLAAALRECDSLLERHGGHAMAAGLSLRPENLEPFRTRLNALAQRTLKPEHLRPALRLDAEVRLGQMTLEQVGELQRLQHTGIGNPPVHLVARGVTHHRPLQRMGAERNHARLWVTDGDGVCEATLWNAGDGPLPVGRFDLAFAPQLNVYNGVTSVRLKVLDWEAVP